MVDVLPCRYFVQEKPRIESYRRPDRVERKHGDAVSGLTTEEVTNQTTNLKPSRLRRDFIKSMQEKENVM
jgi:hypothetical protein